MLEFASVNKIPTPKFSLGPISNATLQMSTVGGIKSMALCYSYLPIVDHLRRLDEETLIGRMHIGSIKILYFTLKCREEEKIE